MLSRIAYFDRVRRSIVYLTHQCISKLCLKHDKLDLFSERLNGFDRLPPDVHCLHHFLQVSMRNQNIDDARTNLFSLVEAVSDWIPSSNCIAVSSIGDTYWEKFVVSEAIKITTTDCGLEAEIHPISEHELSRAKDIVSTALCMIARYDTNMFDEIQEHVQIIKLFQGKSTMGFTDVRILGAMLIRLPRENVNPVLYLLEHIVHEASHIHLNCLMSVDPLILNASHERFVSPLRPDPRPIIGVLHATYVSARVARVFMKLYESLENPELLQPLAETLDEAFRGIIEIKKHAKLTSCGKKLIDSISDFLNIGKSISEWKTYDFVNHRTHRFGAGATRVSELMRAVM